MHSAEQMYELVANVADYPQFLPWCSDAELLETWPGGMRGRIDISKGGLQQSFATRNEVEYGRRMTLELEDGPFSELSGEWRFDPIGEAGCRITLHLQFDFSSAITRMAIGPVFNAIADRLVDAFVERADAVYS